MPLSLALLLTLTPLLLPAAVVADDGVRRLLHEPLFPIEWTPPPSPPASPSPGFSSDPSTPAPPDTVTPAPPQPSTVPAVVSSPGGPAPLVRGSGGTPKAAIVVASAAAAAFLALFAFAAAFLLTGRVPRHPVQPRVPEQPGGHAHVSESLEPNAAAAGSSTASHYRKARHERARRGICHDVDTVQSPELRPLPPLRRESAAVVGPCPSDEEAAYYTPGQHSAGSGSGGAEARGTWTEASASSSSARTTTPSRRSLPSLTSDFFPATPAAAAASASTAAPPPAPPPQRSRRTPPGTRFSAGSANHPPPQPQTFNNPISMRRSLNPARAEDPSIAVRAAPAMAMMKETDDGSSTRTHGNDGGRPRLKPLHREMARGASSDDPDMAWDRLKSNSFQSSEEDMIEVLAMNSAAPRKAGMSTKLRREERVLDPEKEQSIAILMRALNVTPDEVSDALLNGNGECLGAELLETLVKMAPTKEEELKLRDFTGESSKLGSVECFLKAVLDIPFAFKRIDAMLYRANFENEITYLRKCFQTIEAACDDLKGSRLFLKLLEAVLRAGNRMNVDTNRGETAKASKLDTLLKLADVKGANGKTTLLHSAVQEIARSEDEKSDEVAENHIQFRKHGLKVVSGLSSELGSVKKAATMDFDVLHGYVSKLETGVGKITSVILLEKQCRKGEGFFAAMCGFLKEAEQGIRQVRGEERKAMERVSEITGYFHGNTAKEEAHPLRIFMVARDFVAILDRVCREVGQQDRSFVGSARSFRASAATPSPLLNMHGHHGRDDNSDEAVLLGVGNGDREGTTH